MLQTVFIGRFLNVKPEGAGSVETTSVSGFSIDSRTVLPGQCFVAIRGERFDGHDFLKECFDKGVRVFIIQAAFKKEALKALPGALLFVVPDTLQALARLAFCYKNHIFSSVVAITGSSGKTTTRELAVKILSRKFKVHTARKNFNNEIGLPLTILDAPAGTHIMVLELGMNHFGEIARLSDIARPLAGLITNVGYAHIGHFGSRSQVAKAKAELFHGMDKHTYSFINKDDDFFEYFQKRAPGDSYYYSRDDLKVLEDRGLDGYLLEYQGAKFTFCLPGQHNLQNLAGALKLGEFFGIALPDMAAAVAEFRPVSGRSEVKQGSLKVINDCYNANPSSMIAGLKVLGATSGRRVAVLADMLELGDRAKELHKMVGETLGREKLADLVIGYGPMTKHLLEEAAKAGVETVFCQDKPALEYAVEAKVKAGDTVLVKASHGMALESVALALQARL